VGRGGSPSIDPSGFARRFTKDSIEFRPWVIFLVLALSSVGALIVTSADDRARPDGSLNHPTPDVRFLAAAKRVHGPCQTVRRSPRWQSSFTRSSFWSP